ncbi:MAG: hypothetical protein M0R73_07380 [Dehalococcoidia bacterium]|nr:hypothetical protein [Dehalococcoidia bacterium]
MPAPLARWRPRLPSSLSAGALAAVTLVGALAAMALVLGALAVREEQADSRFDLLRWEIDTVPNRWLGVVGAPFREAPPDDEVLAEYFSLSPDDPRRSALENHVERVIEGRIDAVLRDLGLNARIPLPFSVFPPVAIELAISPRVLVISPRHEIVRERTELLKADLTLPDAIRIEHTVEAAAPVFSALVVGSGGVATYPAIVSDRSSYAGVLATAAHEWVHHYLAFYPLGFRYAASPDLRTINETVADLVGREVAQVALERWGDPTRPGEDREGEAPPPPAPAPEPPVDRVTVLRDLRLEVDALLAQGEVEAAERLMEDVRQTLEDGGVYIRRINQAYFAWYGTYAARPDATDPLGEYLREIMLRSGSLPAFLEAVRGAGSRADVIDLLVELGGAPGAED